MTKPIFKIRQAPKAYKLDPEKLKGASQSILPYLFGSNLHYSEDYEYFDKIKPYLDIPEKPKTLDEISQEFNDKIDELIENTKNKFYQSKYISEKLYNTKFDRIIENFEYAKEHGHFPLKLTFNCDGNISLGTSYPTANLEITSNFVIKSTSMNVGYWDVKPNIQIWLQVKPNWLVRKCAKIFFDFGWKDG